MTLLNAVAALVALLIVLQWMKTRTLHQLQRLGTPRLIYLSAFIGVPIHELSHAFFCLVFGHKITSISLLQFDGTHTLGYIGHRYNSRNLYHQCGRFFIGIAPVVGGLSAVLILTIFLFPSIDTSQLLKLPLLYDTRTMSHMLSFHQQMWQQGHLKYAIWLFVTASILSHITPSKSDLEGATYGALFITIIMVGLYWLNSEWLTWSAHFVWGALSVLISCFLAVVLLHVALLMIGRLVSIVR
jgi:hypothetical protein